MALLEHPEAQALLADAELTPEAVLDCVDHLTGFLQRYLPHFYRVEQRHNATTVIRGLLSGLAREMPCPAGGQVPGEVAARAGAVGPQPARLAPRLDHR